MQIALSSRGKLLHEIYTVKLSDEDAAKLKAELLRKRRIFLPMFVFGVGLMLCFTLSLLLMSFADSSKMDAFLEDNVHILIGMSIASLAGSILMLLSVHQCFNVVGQHLKALRIAYPNLPSVPYTRDKIYYKAIGGHDPAEYLTSVKNNNLLEKLKIATVDKARARGLLNYAISGKLECRSRIIPLFVLGILAGWMPIHVIVYGISLSPETSEMIVTLMLVGLAMLAAGFWNAKALRSHCAYINAIRDGYPQFFENQ